MTNRQGGYARDVGDRLRELRGLAGLSQDDVAQAAGISRNHYGLLESGQNSNPRLKTLQGLAYALGVRVFDLLPDISATPTRSGATLPVLSRRDQADRTG